MQLADVIKFRLGWLADARRADLLISQRVPNPAQKYASHVGAYMTFVECRHILHSCNLGDGQRPECVFD